MEAIIKHLKNGGVIAYPTDTIWGLGADIYNEQAVDKVFQLKQRAPSRAISVLVRDIYQAKDLAVITPEIEQLMQVFWPGAVTFVVKCTAQVSEKIHGGTGFVGLRQSSHPWIRDFFKSFEDPITTTSINISGQPSATSKEELDWLPEDILKANYGFEDSDTKGSTVLKVDGTQLSVLREGLVAAIEIENIWDKIVSSQLEHNTN